MLVNRVFMLTCSCHNSESNAAHASCPMWVTSHKSIKLAVCEQPVQTLAEIGLRGTLLLRCQSRGSLTKIRAGRLNERLHGCDDTVRGLSLQGLSLEGLHNIVEDLCGLREHSLVLSRGESVAFSSVLCVAQGGLTVRSVEQGRHMRMV